MPPLKSLTGQAELPFRESSKARGFAAVVIRAAFAAASPHLKWPPR